MASDVPIYLITRITRWASSDLGDAIQLETTVEGGSQVILRTAYHNVPRLVQSLLQAAAIAEQIQRKMPDQGIEFVSPYLATSVESGVSTDGKFVGLLFQTTEGVPIQLTMSPELSRGTIETISEALAKLEEPPQKLS